MRLHNRVWLLMVFSLLLPASIGIVSPSRTQAVTSPLGNAVVKPSNFSIVLPWAPGIERTMTNGYNGAKYHKHIDRDGGSNDYYALDFTFGKGEEVRPIASGTVIYAGSAGPGPGRWSGYGNIVFIDHGNSFQSLYAHLDSVNVSRGQTVSISTKLGGAGKTGTDSVHLHLAVYYQAKFELNGNDHGPYGGRAVIPEPFSNCIKNGGGSCENIENGNRLLSSGGSLCSTPNPGPNQVVLFEHPNFGGRCVVRNYGLYPNPNALGIADDTVSSVKLGDGAAIGLYDRVEYVGSGNFFYGPREVANLGAFDNKTTSSRVNHNALVVTAVRSGTSTRLHHACWIAAKDGDFATWSVFGQCDAWRNPQPDGMTPFGAYARGLLGLPPGNYILREFIAPAGYSKAPDRTITIAAGATTRITVPHNPAPAREASTKVPSFAKTRINPATEMSQEKDHENLKPGQDRSESNQNKNTHDKKHKHKKKAKHDGDRDHRKNGRRDHDRGRH